MNQMFLSHLVPGLYFLINGLWHLFNHIKLYSLNPNSYTFLPWFPAAKSRYLELYLPMAIFPIIFLNIFVFVTLRYHSPYHLSDVEHACIFLSYSVYCLFAFLLDLPHNPHPRAGRSLTLILNALAYIQGFFIFHFHSTDHEGLEGHYHAFLEVLVLVCAATTLLGIGFPKSFSLGFARSLSVMFLGAWIIFLGAALWGGPAFLAKGCFLKIDDTNAERFVICSSQKALQRAKSLANLQFSCFIIGIAVFGASLYLALVRVYNGKENIQYNKLSITKNSGDHMDGDEEEGEYYSDK